MLCPANRIPLVGREQELRRLQIAFDQAIGGHGSLVLITGEPGIGKTALCRQFLAMVAAQGGLGLSGHCYEEGERSLPYLPLVEAINAYAQAHDLSRFQKTRPVRARELARIVPDLQPRVSSARVRVRNSPRRSAVPRDPEQARYQLFQAIAALLQHACADQPLCLVLEGLHDADRGTRNLLLHLTRGIERVRLLILGSYRDTEIHRGHSLSSALAELQRVTTIERVSLHGLAREHVQQIVESITGQAVAPEWADRVRLQTEGNPLFTQEISRFLAEDGVLRKPMPHRPSSDGPALFKLPDGLKDVIGKRFSRLSPDCTRVLNIAAIIGREFRFDTLQLVADLPDSALLGAVEEGVRAAVLEERGATSEARFRFTHALFRQLLYEEMIAPLRLRLHQRVATALEQQYGNRLAEHAADLAEHFAQSPVAADLTKAVAYSELAAEQALGVHALSDAVSHLERAVQVQELADPADVVKQCDLLIALGEAPLLAGEVTRLVDVVASHALALADKMADHQRASRACQQALLGLMHRDHQRGFDSESYRTWGEAADRYAEPGSLSRVYADTAMVPPMYMVEERPHEAWALLMRAINLAETLGEGEALYRAVAWLFNHSWLPEHQAERLRLVCDLASRPRDGVSERTFGQFLVDCCIIFLDWGMRSRAEATLRQARAIQRQMRDAWILALSLMHDAVLKTLDGGGPAGGSAGRARAQGAEQLHRPRQPHGAPPQ